MKKFLHIFFLILFFPNVLFAKSEYFNQGVKLFNKDKFEDAKFKFEQDIVFNPKSELSYLYLSKIFNKQEKRNLEEQNLKTVMLLNPKNEEAIYNLAKLKLKSSDFANKTFGKNKIIKKTFSNFFIIIYSLLFFVSFLRCVPCFHKNLLL